MAVSQSLSVTESSYSTANNTSTVRIKWTSTQSGESHNDYTRTAYYYVSVNGGSETKYSVSYTLPQSKTQTIVDRTLTVNHREDGTGTIKVRTYMSTNISAGVVEKSKTLTLTSIARASSFSVSNDNRTLGVAQTIEATKKISTYTHSLSWAAGTYGGEIATMSNQTTWSFTPPLELANTAPNNDSVYCVFTLSTFDETGKNLGSTQVPVYFAIPESVTPSVSSMTLSDASGYLTRFGGYVQGKSKLKMDVTSTTQYGATQREYIVSLGDASMTIASSEASFSGVSDVIAVSGTQTVSVSVMDSRGRTGTKSSNITVHAYSAPKIGDLDVYRCNSDGTENASGNYIKVVYSYSITNVNGKNTKSVQLKYKKSSTSTYTTVTLPSTNYSATNASYIFEAESSYAYDVSIVATDYFGDVTRSTSASSGYVFMHFGNNGRSIAFGMPSNNNGFENNMPSRFYNDVTFDKSITLGGPNSGKSVYSADGTNTVGILSTNGDKNAFIGVSAESDGGYVAIVGDTVMINEAVLSDFIVNQGFTADGTSGSWIWRMWNSGIAECFGRYSGSIATTTASGNVFTQSVWNSQKTWPVPFVETPITTVTLEHGNYIGVVVGNNASATLTPQWRGVSAISRSSTTVYYNFKAIGKWK